VLRCLACAGYHVPFVASLPPDAPRQAARVTALARNAPFGSGMRRDWVMFVMEKGVDVSTQVVSSRPLSARRRRPPRPRPPSASRDRSRGLKSGSNGGGGGAGRGGPGSGDASTLAATGVVEAEPSVASTLPEGETTVRCGGLRVDVCDLDPPWRRLVLLKGVTREATEAAVVSGLADCVGEDQVRGVWKFIQVRHRQSSSGSACCCCNTHQTVGGTTHRATITQGAAQSRPITSAHFFKSMLTLSTDASVQEYQEMLRAARTGRFDCTYHAVCHGDTHTHTHTHTRTHTHTHTNA